MLKLYAPQKLVGTHLLATDLVVIALRQLFRNKRRYRGAIIGTTIGIAGLLTVLTVGDSVEANLGMNLEILGTATIVKASWDIQRSQRWHQGEYTRDDAIALGKIPGVFAVSATVFSGAAELTYMRKKFKARAIGIDANFFDTMNLNIGYGTRFTAKDVEQDHHVCVIGQTIGDKLFGKHVDAFGPTDSFERALVHGAGRFGRCGG